MTDKNVDNSLSEDDFLELSNMEPKIDERTLSALKVSSESEVETGSESAPDSLAASNRLDAHILDSEKVELKSQISSGYSDDYFDDDEEFLRGDDVAIHEASDLALFKQDENVVSWEIVNFYKEGLTPRGKMALRNDPPIMKISSSSGDTAEFLVTKDFSKSLGSILEDVNKAYYGISPKNKSGQLTQDGIKNKFRSMGQWMLAHKVKTAVAVVVAALLMTALLT